MDRQVPDSAATASALFTGVKTNFKTVGFDSSVEYNSLESALKARKVDSVLKWAQQSGMRTGKGENVRERNGFQMSSLC